jgi:hypothetical protein
LPPQQITEITVDPAYRVLLRLAQTPEKVRPFRLNRVRPGFDLKKADQWVKRILRFSPVTTITRPERELKPRVIIVDGGRTIPKIEIVYGRPAKEWRSGRVG